MATLILATAGSYLGGAIGGTVGASIGWAVGSYIGGLLEPPIKQEGPRLDDLRVTSASEGSPIPVAYGTVRLAGQIIWTAPIKEVRHVEETGGKGGPRVETTTYTYYGSFAVGLCEGEVVGFRRIWANGKVIYDSSNTASIEAVSASVDGVTFYRGTELQQPDPLIEAHEGAGNVPAHRGLVYLVFDDLPLAEYGNRIPNIEVEVCVTASESYVVQDGIGYPNDQKNFFWWHDDGVISYLETGFAWGTELTVEEQTYGLSGQRFESRNVTFSYSGAVSGDSDGIELQCPVRNDPGLAVVWVYRTSYPSTWNKVATWAVGNGSSYQSTATPLTDVDGTPLGDDGVFPYYFVSHAYAWGDYVYLIRGAWQNEVKELLVFDRHGATGANYRAFGQFTASSDDIERFTDVFADDRGVWVIGRKSTPNGRTKIYLLDHKLNNLLGEWDNLAETSTPGFTVDEAMRAGIVDGETGAWYVYQLDSGGGSTLLGSGTVYSNGYSIQPYAIKPGLVFGYGGWINTGLMGAGTVSLASVVSDLCQRGGLEVSEIDATGLTDTVRGYVIGRPMSVRAGIEPLQQAFWFDVCESGAQMRFVARGGSSQATIPDDELGAHEYGDSQPDDLVQTRMQEMELPRRVRVHFMNHENDHQVGQQYAARVVTAAETEQDVRLAIVMTPAEAAQAADVLLYDAWTSRMSYEFTLGPKWTRLEPADLVTVRGMVMRLTGVDYRFPGLIRCKAVADDADVYDRTAAGVPSIPPGSSLGHAGPTSLWLLDIPLLRDRDDSDGFYMAASGYYESWPGCVIYKSADNGGSWASQGSITTGAITGVTTDALPPPTSPWCWDRVNSVNVQLRTGSLSSVTELAVLNGANAALLQSGVGWELIQFADATLEADGSYTLRTLLRGRRGTEWAVDGHAVGDRFILLSSESMLRFDDDLGLQRLFRAPTIGATLQGAAEQSFTNTGVGLKPYAPVHVSGDRSGGDLTVSWVRRTRVGGEWRDYVDASLGESAELYDVEIYSDPARTTLVDSVTDHGSTSYTSVGAPDPAYVSIYQKSATVGRGFVAEATL